MTSNSGKFSKFYDDNIKSVARAFGIPKDIITGKPLFDREKLLRALPIGEKVSFNYVIDSVKYDRLPGEKWGDTEYYMEIRGIGETHGHTFHVFYQEISHPSIQVTESLLGIEIVMQPNKQLVTENDFLNFIKSSHPDITDVTAYTDTRKHSIAFDIKWKGAADEQHMQALYKTLEMNMPISVTLEK
jgi:hypothetical protein